MGQRTSMQQQPASEITRRHRPNDSSSSSTNRATSSHQHGLRRSSNSNSSPHSRFQQQNDSSSLSSSDSSLAEEDIRSEEGTTGGADLAAVFMRSLGFNTDLGAIPEANASTGPTSSSHQHSRGRGRHSEGNGTGPLNGATASLFHNRSVQHQNHPRLGGSQRLRGRQSGGFGGSSSTSANELLASGRLNALLQSLDAAVSNTTPASSTSSTSLRAMGTQQQQAVLNRLRHSLPLLQLLGRDIKCPVCSKNIPSDDVEVHLLMCLTRPVLSYNDDVLTADKGECAICLEEMGEGDHIARLPCLCIYHKDCIDEWFKRKNTCPERPPNEDD